MRFVSPANGARDVARFPVLSIGFASAIPDEPDWLAARIRLLDRRGRPVPLLLRRSRSDPTLAIATPRSRAERLLPAADYFLELHGPDGIRRTHFATGAAKSVFCGELDTAGRWRSSCDESYWRADPAERGEPCPPATGTGGDCRCGLTVDADAFGGRRAECVCDGEERFDAGSAAGPAVVSALSPAPGERAPETRRIALRFDRPLAASADGARLYIDDVTDPSGPPVELLRAEPRRAGTELSIETDRLRPDRRYRVTLREPADGSRPFASSHAGGVRWSFNTWRDPGEPRFVAALPTPRTPGVDFATHLPTRPHLRFRSSAPLVEAVATSAPLALHRHDGERVLGHTSWLDRDLDRLHLMVYHPLEPGQRYRVSCSEALARTLGDQACREPLARFLVQVDPPEDGVADVRYGSRASLAPEDEIWLPARPTVLNHAHGLKERYQLDARGPVRFLGHVLLAPADTPPDARTIAVDPGPGCRDSSGAPGPELCRALLAGETSACTLGPALRCALGQERPAVIELAPGRHRVGLAVEGGVHSPALLVRGRPGAAPPVLHTSRSLSGGVAFSPERARLRLSREDCARASGFVWRDESGTCAPDPSHLAFACSAGGGCISRWVQIDRDRNLWQLWWPALGRLGGNYSLRFALRGGTPPREIAVLDAVNPDYDPCDRVADTTRCVFERCREWGHGGYRGQLEQKLAELSAAPGEGAAALWLTGRAALPVLGCDTLAGVGQMGRAEQPAAPAALFLRTPAGSTPAQLGLEGGPGDPAPLSLVGVRDWTFRGLRFAQQAAPILLRDVENLRFEANQFAGPARNAVSAHRATRGLRIAHGYHRGIPLLVYASSEPGFVIENNLLWRVRGKAVKSRYSGPTESAPRLCSAGEPGCTVPACAADRDCRIPFLAADGSTRAGARDAPGPQPTCARAAPGPGVCSRGLSGQTLISDNLFLGAAGVDTGGGPWYALRLQRNHFEGTRGQELFDASYGALYTSLLDNLSFDSPSGSRLVVLNTTHGSEPGRLRNVAFENNALLRTAPGLPVQLAKGGRARPGARSAAFVTTAQPRHPNGVRASGLRVVGNLLLGRPGGREWGLGASGGISVLDATDVLIARNTVLVDSAHGIWLGRGRNAVEPSGDVIGNLVVTTGRADYRANLCRGPVGPGLVAPDSPEVRVSGNAATRAAPGTRALAAEAREWLLIEPLPASPVIDAELFQRALAPGLDEATALERDWPHYDPALLDDVLRVRPGHPACASGALRHPLCRTQTRALGAEK